MRKGKPHDPFPLKRFDTYVIDKAVLEYVRTFDELPCHTAWRVSDRDPSPLLGPHFPSFPQRMIAVRRRSCQYGSTGANDGAMAKLYFNYSTMNAGKSTVLLQASHNYIERGMQTYLLIARFDDRAGVGRIGSRIGIGADADTFGAEDDLFEMIAARLNEGPCACVFLDEAHFMTPDHVWQLARVVDDLGVPVMTYGLRVDFRGRLFPASASLLAIADEMREVRTICHCGKKATMVVRQDADGNVLASGDQIVVGGNETYVSLCRRHWREEMGAYADPNKP